MRSFPPCSNNKRKKAQNTINIITQSKKIEKDKEKNIHT
jgi:hypothetical protein